MKRKRLGERESLSILYQMTEAFKELDYKKIMHRDIKPSNILIKEDFTSILTDYGIIKELNEINN
jgi:serine/threonine-protein kinase